ncbi:MAG: N(4)-(beta-N-acetylglucosaminyl)-L-asparaginase [Planctomycetes bacterium]|nr:N(4)-(beta-N-acetylglucosaminyl)-L-asparaginase [Planctomycetota bacterium]
MTDHVTRRGFLRCTTGAVAGAGLLGAAALDAQAMATIASEADTSTSVGAGKPIVISSGNGSQCCAKAMEIIHAGGDPLDAIIAGVNLLEEDPAVRSVGYGGLPNEDGVVELDSCVMHGPTHNAGAVAALRDTMYASRVARLVMDRTDHVLLVGDGALKFARAHGYGRDEMLTDDARKTWLQWKEKHGDKDMWLPPPEMPDEGQQSAADSVPFSYGTIHCSALDAAGHLYGVTTTSGRSYKLPGRVGDSPIIGAGCYVDNEVGAAGSTGRGEAVIVDCGAFAVVAAMRGGLAPTEACLAVLERMVDHNRQPHLRRKDGRPTFQVIMYALAKDGRFGAAGIWPAGSFAVNVDGDNRKVGCASLYQRPEKSG